MTKKSFTNQLPQTATEQQVNAWAGGPENFRCSMCGYKFEVGDYWRWVYADCPGVTLPITGERIGLCNLKTCKDCDGPDILDRWVKKHEKFYSLSNWALWKER